jgi:hypothetical protein
VDGQHPLFYPLLIYLLLAVVEAVAPLHSLLLVQVVVALADTGHLLVFL